MEYDLFCACFLLSHFQQIRKWLKTITIKLLTGIKIMQNIFKLNIKIFIYLILSGAIVFQFCGCASFPKSNHCDGSKFYNDAPGHSFSDEIKWFWEMETIPWPEEIVDLPQPKPLPFVANGKLRVTYINQATILIQMDGKNILTDPIFSYKAGPFTFLGSKRVRKPGVAIDDLPKIDIILISHNHYDHLDLPTMKDLAERDKPIVCAGLGVKNLINDMGFSNIAELDWWQNYSIPEVGIKFIFVPAFHNSGRGLFDGDKSLWGGFVIEGMHGRIYFAGDTAYGSFLQKIHGIFPEFSLTIFPIGSYEKRWIMKTQHMNPDDAVKAHILLNSKQSIGMHYATFLEHPEQTIDQHEKDLSKALEDNFLPQSNFFILDFGQGIDIK
jgi:L-ascorbate metabolism protein UlaG (beta-lactamase superfamily)